MASALPLLAAAPPSDILIVDTETVTSRYAELFNGSVMRVVTTAQVPVALEYLRRSAPELVVTELALEEGNPSRSVRPRRHCEPRRRSW